MKTTGNKTRRRTFRSWALAALLAVLLPLSACRGRVLYMDRSIPAQVGYPDAETYVQALRQTPLGVLGCTWSELTEAGYLTEEEGTWTSLDTEKRVYTVHRMVGRTDSRTEYVFRPTLFTEAEGKPVLTDIRVEFAPYDKENLDYLIRAQGKALLEGWTVLNDCFAQYEGAYTRPLAAGENAVWEFLDWMKRPEDLEDITAAIDKGWKLSYSVRCSPVTVGDCLTEAERETLTDLAVEKGWAKDREEGLELFRGWHLAALVSKNVPGCWTLSGMGLALYLTRPGAGD